MKQSWHSFLLKIHLIGGLAAAGFLLILGATGSVMAFESDIDRLLHPSLFRVTSPSIALPLSTLAKNAAATLKPGEHIGICILPTAPDSSYAFAVLAANELPHQVFVDGFTGHVLGGLSVVRFVIVAHKLHEAGGILMGCVAMILIPLVLSGLYLWWPIKQIKIRIGGAGQSFCFDLHNSVGFLSSLFLLVFAVTGSYMAFEEWTVPATYKLTRTKPLPEPLPSTPMNPADVIPPERAIATARNSMPAAIPLWIVIPQSPTGRYLVKMRFPEDHSSNGASAVWIDQYTGRVLAAWNSRTAPLGRKLESLVRDIHAGDLWGYPGRSVECCMSLCLVVQAISGPYLWWRRRRDKQVLSREPLGT